MTVSEILVTFQISSQIFSLEHISDKATHGVKHSEVLFIHFHHPQSGQNMCSINRTRLQYDSRIVIDHLHTVFSREYYHFIFQVRPRELLRK